MTNYLGAWYEWNPNTGQVTLYAAFNGQAVAMKEEEHLGRPPSGSTWAD